MLKEAAPMPYEPIGAAHVGICMVSPRGFETGVGSQVGGGGGALPLPLASSMAIGLAEAKGLPLGALWHQAYSVQEPGAPASKDKRWMSQLEGERESW